MMCIDTTTNIGIKWQLHQYEETKTIIQGNGTTPNGITQDKIKESLQGIVDYIYTFHFGTMEYIPIEEDDKNLDTTNLPHTFKRLRELRGWSIEDVANKLDVKDKIIYRLESGYSYKDAVKMTQRLANLYGYRLGLVPNHEQE